MDAFQLETKLQQLTDELSTENFIFDFLLAYGMPKSNISRLKKKSDVNSLFTDGELLVKNKKFLFKVVADVETLKLEDLVETHKGMRIVMLTDYGKLCAYDTKTKMTLEIEFDELSKNYDFFLPLAGVEKTLFYDEKEADVKASVKMAKLFDEIKKSNSVDNDSEIRALNVFLTRLLFCFFAEDSNMFGATENLFTNYIDTVSKSDGSDLHKHIEILFDTLNSENRNIATNLQDFPYVNGGLFKDSYPIPTFTTRSRKLLIECGSELNWSQINPDIFGSMIQAVVSEEHRGGLGMHYTSVPNIMKVIEPLFLDELHEEFEKVKGNTKKLNQLHQRIINLKIFDPACGSGNFLIIAYKELRSLEINILEQINLLENSRQGDLFGKTIHQPSFLSLSSGIELSQFYGIELDDFAHEVAILSLWLTEHQMNLKFTEKFGSCRPSLPLHGGGNIVHGNATRLEWEDVCPREEDDEIYILGNPPYLGSSRQKKEQKDDMSIVFNGIKSYKKLDYITSWFYKASLYIKDINSRYAFVTTNSICQGEQVGLLWSNIFRLKQEIFFAYQSFKWKNNAKNNAGVSVVIIGVCNTQKIKKNIYSSGVTKEVKSINAYLVEGDNIIVQGRRKSLSSLPEMTIGSKISDNGYLTLSELEKNEIINQNSKSHIFIKKYIGAKDFMNNNQRYIIFVTEKSKEEAYSIPAFKHRFEQVAQFRLSSQKKATKRKGLTPYLFDEVKHKNISSIVIPQTGSEKREYVPIGLMDKDTVISNGLRVIYSPELWIFGLIASKLHMIWVKAVAGRMKTDMQYSNTICYNTFPFPKITDNQKNEIEKLVNSILDARDEEFTKTLAELYDPDKMPDNLRQAHKNLDLYIEQCYRKKPFESDEERLAYLFKEYEKMIKKEDAK